MFKKMGKIGENADIVGNHLEIIVYIFGDFYRIFFNFNSIKMI
jgi:hypothetical protein